MKEGDTERETYVQTEYIYIHTYGVYIVDIIYIASFVHNGSDNARAANIVHIVYHVACMPCVRGIE